MSVSRLYPQHRHSKAAQIDFVSDVHSLEFIHGRHASKFQRVVFVSLAFDVRPRPGVLISRAYYRFEPKAHGEVVNPARGSTRFHDTRSAGYEITALSVATCSEQSRDRAFQDPRQNTFASHRLDVWDRLVPAVDVD